MRAAKIIAFLALALPVPVSSEAGVARGRALRSGQTTSYGAVGDTTAGLPRAYVDLGNGVIKDQKTALFWEKKDDSGGIHDKDNKYTWGSTGVPDKATGTAFTVFLAALNTPPCFAGYCDWRMPTVKELYTLTDQGAASPAVPAIFNSNCAPGCTVTTCSCTVSNDYWSSSTTHNYPTYAWRVQFDYGHVSNGTYTKTGPFHVRAVRGGS